MKRFESFCSHAGTVLPVMLLVFLSINTVNEAMAFYDHPYTKVLLLFTCFLLGANALLLSRRSFLFPPAAYALCAFASVEALLALSALIVQELPLYTGLFGQLLAWGLCLFTLFLSLFSGFAPDRRR